MGSDWTLKKIGEFAEVKGGKRLPKGKRLSEKKTTHPYIRVVDFTDGRISLSNLLYVPEEVFPNIKRYIVESGDVVISIVGTIGLVATIPTELHEANLTENAAKILIEDTTVDSQYLSYYLKSSIGQHEIQRNTVGSTQPKLPLYGIKNIEVSYPPLPEQRAIAHILGSLDDKIELNRRMNKTLEAMARAIFKSWFVDFDPVHAKAEGRPTGLPDDIAALFPDSFEDSELGEIPTGWEVVTFEELIDAKQGMYIPKNNMTDLPSSEYPYPVWGGNGIRGYAATFMYKEPVVVLTCRGSNCGRIDLTESPAWISNIAFACSPKCGSVNFINVYLAYSSLTDTITGSAQPQITYTSLRNKRMQFPVHKEVCDAYSDYIDRLYDVIRGNNRQSRTLASLRDTLLPKLISGELRVPDAEKLVEEAGL